MAVVDTGENPGIGLYVFTGECPLGQPRPSQEGQVEWVSFPDAASLPAVEDLPLFLERIQKMKRTDPPFSARSFYNGENKLRVEFTI